jgi:hypothetical protein
MGLGTSSKVGLFDMGNSVRMGLHRPPEGGPVR